MRLVTALKDEEFRKELYKFFIEELKDMGVEKMFNNEDVTSIVLAKEAIDKAFEDLALQFAPKVEPKEIINDAR